MYNRPVLDIKGASQTLSREGKSAVQSPHPYAAVIDNSEDEDMSQVSAR